MMCPMALAGIGAITARTTAGRGHDRVLRELQDQIGIKEAGPSC